MADDCRSNRHRPPANLDIPGSSRAHKLRAVDAGGREECTRSVSLIAFVRASEAKNAGELGGQPYLATGRLAGKLSHTVLGVNGLLWKLKS